MGTVQLFFSAGVQPGFFSGVEDARERAIKIPELTAIASLVSH